VAVYGWRVSDTVNRMADNALRKVGLHR